MSERFAPGPEQTGFKTFADRFGLDSVMQRDDEIGLTLTATGLVEVETATGRKQLTGHVLAILDVFAIPTTIREALEVLGRRSRAAADFQSMMGALLALIDYGVLVSPSLKKGGISREPYRYSAGNVHVRMLNDRVRTSAFLDAISQVVRPGDVVVDLGSGTGVLAIHAAKAGASRVFAIEASSMADVAASSVETNRLSDRITMVRGWSKAVALPERADVLVSELIGNDPFDEDLIDVLVDARQRFLKPGGRIIPMRLEAFAQPYEIPDEQMDRLTFTVANTAAWEDWYGVRFVDFAGIAAKVPHFILTNPAALEGWRALADPVDLLGFSTDQVTLPAASFDRSFTFTESGRCNGLLIYFDAGVSSGIKLTTQPGKAATRNHWACRVWLFPGGLPAREGCPGRLGLARRRGIVVESFSAG